MQHQNKKKIYGWFELARTRLWLILGSQASKWKEYEITKSYKTNILIGNVVQKLVYRGNDLLLLNILMTCKTPPLLKNYNEF